MALFIGGPCLRQLQGVGALQCLIKKPILLMSVAGMGFTSAVCCLTWPYLSLSLVAPPAAGEAAQRQDRLSRGRGRDGSARHCRGGLTGIFHSCPESLSWLELSREIAVSVSELINCISLQLCRLPPILRHSPKPARAGPAPPHLRWGLTVSRSPSPRPRPLLYTRTVSWSLKPQQRL